jgi:ribosomal protein S27AE
MKTSLGTVEPPLSSSTRPKAQIHTCRRLSSSSNQGIEAVQVVPRNTSKRCSPCGFTHDHNRHGEEFECQKCGYQNHADHNAVVRLRLTGSKREVFATAKHIGLQYLRRPQKSLISGV